MKKNIILGLAINFYLVAVSQIPLANSQWKVRVLIPQSVMIVFDFKKDSLYLVTEDGERFGTLIFSQRQDSLMIRKISGASPCPEEAEGWYRIKWLENGEKFQLQVISDECEGRIQPFTSETFERVRRKDDIPRNWSHKKFEKGFSSSLRPALSFVR